MVLNVHDLSDTTNIVSTLNEHCSSVFEFNNLIDLVCFKVKLDSIVLLDFWVGVADSSAVVGHNIRNFVLAKALSLHLAQLETCLLSINANWLESSLDVVHDAEVLAGFWDGYDVLEAKWEPWISSDFVVNFDIVILVSADFDRILAGECVFKSVLEEDSQRNALTQLVWSSRGACCIHSS